MKDFCLLAYEIGKSVGLIAVLLCAVAAIPVGLATIPLWCHACVKEVGQ